MGVKGPVSLGKLMSRVFEALIATAGLPMGSKQSKTEQAYMRNQVSEVRVQSGMTKRGCKVEQDDSSHFSLQSAIPTLPPSFRDESLR